jgi:tetratricopeptide (TPR) repeat protein
VDALRELIDRTMALRKTGGHKQALHDAERAVEWSNKLAYAPARAEALNLLAMYRGAGGLVNEEIATWRDTIRAAAVARRDDILSQAWTRLMLAECEKEPEVALSLRLPAEAAVLRDHDNPHRRITLLSAVGGAYAAQGKLTDARQAYVEALHILEAQHPPDEQSLGMIQVELANMEDILGDIESARIHYQQALELWTRVLGPGHPDLAIASYNFGDFLQSRGRYAEAWERFEGARKIWEDMFGPDHEHVAAALVSLAGMKWLEGDFAQARQWMERAVQIRTKVYGADHPLTAPSYAYLGGVYTRLKQFDEARRYIDRALQIQTSAPSPSAVELAQSQELLAEWHLAQGHTAEARRLFLKAQAGFASTLSKDSSTLAVLLVDLARCSLKDKRPADGVTPATQALEMLQHSPSANPFDVAVARFILGQTLWDVRGEAPRARRLVAQAREELARAGRYRANDLHEVDDWLRQHP